MDELQDEITNLTSNEEARYFYHFTNASGDKILEEGLVVANPLWEQSFLEFSKEELANIASVLDANKSTIVKNNTTMIIAGVYKDSMDGFIRKLRPEEGAFLDFEGVGAPDYIVDSNDLLGYIDLENLELIINEYASVLSDNLYLD